MGKNCSFCGHGKEWDLPLDIDVRIENTIINLIGHGVVVFIQEEWALLIRNAKPA